MFKTFLTKCIDGKTFTEKEAKEVMDMIMNGKATSSQISSLISVMRYRGETVEEMTGFVKSMREHMITVDYEDENVIDTCGTGGDGASTFNISTASAIVLSALGVKVAKHGNRAVSSKSGSADVLEKLNIDIQSTTIEAKRALKEKGMSFLFAPLYHRAMKYAAVPRKEIGFRTIFNLLGPLSNPAQCKRQIIGVYDTDYAEIIAKTLSKLGSEHVLLVTGKDGLDEISITDQTDIVELINGEIQRYVIQPEDFGLERGTLSDITVSSVEESANLIKNIFQGKGNKSATNIVLLNAGAGLYVANRASCIAEGVHMVRDALNAGMIDEFYQRLQEDREREYHA